MTKINNEPPALPEFVLTPGDYGWSARLVGAPLFLDKEISLEIHTRLIPGEPKILPPVSRNQAALVREIIPMLHLLLQRIESELTTYSNKFEPGFRMLIREPHIWLDFERDDGVSWSFVVGRTDNPDFGYHIEFRKAEFVELWAGD